MIDGRQPAINQQEAQTLVNQFIQEAETRKHAEMAAKGVKVKAEGEDFLKANQTAEGVITLPSGLQYKVLKEGSGKKPKATDQVKCHYEGTLIDGTVFDSSYRRGEPAVFPLNGVDRRRAADERRCQIQILHPIQPRIWRKRSRKQHPALCSPHFRCRTH